LPKSSSLPTLPTFSSLGDTLLQSHCGKRRYHRRGSRSPSMFTTQPHTNINYATEVAHCMIPFNFNRLYSASAAATLTSLSAGPTTVLEPDAISLSNHQYNDDHDHDDDAFMGIVALSHPARHQSPTVSSIVTDLDRLTLSLLTQSLTTLQLPVVTHTATTCPKPLNASEIS
jgi:hypothetical protein